MSVQTWLAKCRRWAMIAPTSRTASVCLTLTHAMWLTATGCCTTSPTTGEEPTIWDLVNTADTATGVVLVQELARSGESLTSTRSLSNLLPFSVLNKTCWAYTVCVSLYPVWFYCVFVFLSFFLACVLWSIFEKIWYTHKTTEWLTICSSPSDYRLGKPTQLTSQLKSFKRKKKKQLTEQWLLDGFIDSTSLTSTNIVSHSDTSDGSHPRTHASPLIKPPVLTRANQELASSVMWMLIEDPVTSHIAGVDVTELETLIQGGAVIGQLHHLASKLWTLVDHHSVTALVLQNRYLSAFRTRTFF